MGMHVMQLFKLAFRLEKNSTGWMNLPLHPPQKGFTDMETEAIFHYSRNLLALANFPMTVVAVRTSLMLVLTTSLNSSSVYLVLK